MEMQSIKIKDFKSIKSLVLPLRQLNEVYGANATGKSSVLQAVHFCLQGGKNDVEKIRIGADKAVVEMLITQDKVDYEVKTSINKKGMLYCTMKENGKAVSHPRTLIRKMLSFGTFNPREILNKENRLTRLLSLIPIKVKPEDLKVLPLTKPISYELHAHTVLQLAESDLRDTRLNVGREKDLLNKAYLKRKADFETACLDFHKNYDTDPLSFNKTFEDEVRSQAQLETLVDEAQEKEQIIKQGLADVQSALEEANTGHQRRAELIVSIEKENMGLQAKIEQNNLQIANMKEKQSELEAEKKRHIEKIEKLSGKRVSIEKQIAKDKERLGIYDNQIKMARSSSSIKEVAKDLKIQGAVAKQKEEEWEKYDSIIKKILPALRAKILSPIKEKISGLDIMQGSITFDGVDIDELSGSEIINLGIKLMALDKTKNFLLLNEAEALDAETIKDINFKDFKTVILARVADKPISAEGWNSITLDK